MSVHLYESLRFLTFVLSTALITAPVTAGYAESYYFGGDPFDTGHCYSEGAFSGTACTHSPPNPNPPGSLRPHTTTPAEEEAAQKQRDALQIMRQKAQSSGNLTKAFRIYLSILQALPIDTPIGDSYNDYKSAIELSKRIHSLPLLPEDYRKAMVLALFHVKRAKSREGYKQARYYFIKASKLAPWTPQPYEALGRVEEALKNYSDAKRYLRLYLLADPHARNARAIQDHIYELEEEAKGE